MKLNWSTRFVVAGALVVAAVAGGTATADAQNAEWKTPTVAVAPASVFVPQHSTTYFPTHTHEACLYSAGSTYQCQRWILANGAIVFGPFSLMMAQYNYVLVWCSYSNNSQGWLKQGAKFGPWKNTGDHYYCRHPMSTYTHWLYGYGTWPWSWRTG